MHARRTCAALVFGVALAGFAGPAAAQHEVHGATGEREHRMWSVALGRSLRLTGMAQVFPLLSASAVGDDGPLHETRLYATQPALMLRLADADERFSLRTTFNFEGWTQRDGETGAGTWGEGLIDRRHPHTLLHELVASAQFWLGSGMASLSAGKGFAPFGTDDPMVRPGVKYPTNHHLSQVLERWLVSGAWQRGGWSFEAGVFGGEEPTSPWDLSNIESFADSWSVRVTRRWTGAGTRAANWEASGSFADVVEDHGDGTEHTRLVNIALRLVRPLASGEVYALVEGSRSWPEDATGLFSLLGEIRLDVARHQPYARVEYARRPEYAREGINGDGFFRYSHDDQPMGTTRWLIFGVAYAYRVSDYPVSIVPFFEVQYYRVFEGNGLEPRILFGGDSFWGLVVGARVLLGGEGVRMGGYGVVDGMR